MSESHDIAGRMKSWCDGVLLNSKVPSRQVLSRQPVVPLVTVFTAVATSALTLRLAGVRARPSMRGMYWPRRNRILFTLVSSLPLAGTMAQYGLAPQSNTVTALLFLAYFVVLDWCAVLSALLACSTFQVVADDVETMLGTADNRISMLLWLSRGADWKRQVPYTLLGAVISMVLLAFTSRDPGVQANLFIGPLSYICVFWTGCLVCNCAYWALHAVGLTFALRRMRGFSLSWPAPARTVGIEGAARTYRVAAFVGGLGTAVYSVPLFYISSVISRSQDIQVLKTGLLLLGVGTTILLGAITQIELSRIVWTARSSSLRRIEAALPGLAEVGDGKKLQESGAAQLLTLYAQICASPSTTVNDRTIVALLFGCYRSSTALHNSTACWLMRSFCRS